MQTNKIENIPKDGPLGFTLLKKTLIPISAHVSPSPVGLGCDGLQKESNIKISQ